MKPKMIWRNFVNSKVISLTMILFIAMASMLLSLATILTVNLSGALDKLMVDAKTPHFMQMHSGNLDVSKLKTFADYNDNVTDFQVFNFLNIDNSQIILGDNSLANSLQDNGVCIQSKQFDFLLDLNNTSVQPKNGELYVPVCYFKDGTTKIGDSAFINGKPFVVAGFIRDSQMNSTLASSKRFLVSEEDFSLLEPFGNIEYLIEFRLNDLSKLNDFETAYSSAGLPANGPVLTLPLFQMISAISDGIMIAVIVLIAILVIFVALLCIRFTLLAKIEDDYREIGVMKAIGMRVSDIQKIYLIIYASIAGMGSILGYLLSLLFQRPLRESIRLNLGESGNDAFALTLGIVGMIFVFMLIFFYVSWNLQRFRKISAVQAIRFGTESLSKYGAKKVRLSENKFSSTNFFLGVKDVLARKNLYITMLVVIVLASFIMIVPQNLYHTISKDNFVTYIGVGNCDIRLDIQQTSQIDEKTLNIGKYMKADSEIKNYALFISKIFQIKLDNGIIENIKVELGDHTVFPLQYAKGREPIKEDEIALSAINAEELEKNVGEQIVLITSDGEKQLTICGIYSDITNGGKTAKAVFTDNYTKAIWSVICADLTEKEQLPNKISEYTQRFPYAKISSIDEYMAQTFGQTLQSVQSASLSAIIVSVVITLLVTVLFMKLLIAKDRYSISVLRAIGFTSLDIRYQYIWRVVFVLAIGIILGTVLAGTLGEKLSAVAISSFGATTFHFTINPLVTYLLFPLLLVSVTLIATVLGTLHAGDVQLCESIKE